MADAYITGTGIFLPNEPIENAEIEDVLGRVDGRDSKVKDWVLDYNGIESRHYAVDPNTGKQTHTNSELTAEAIRAAVANAELDLSAIECLACGTSSADQGIPSHASMVHGELSCPPCEVISTTGVCCSGMSAMKYAYMNVRAGESTCAVSSGSELASVSFRAKHFEHEMNARKLQEFEELPELAFENEFLRWMLSDGAGAVVITPEPRTTGVSLRIDWIDLVSFANDAETCMYYGAVKQEDGSLVGYRAAGAEEDLETFVSKGYMNLSQDVQLLRSDLPKFFREALIRTHEKHSLNQEIDWVLPHYSSESFREPLYDGLVAEGAEIPYDKWFTNLKWKGNTGSASIYIIIDELISSGRAQPGQKILCAIPESARFTFSIMHLTVI